MVGTAGPHPPVSGNTKSFGTVLAGPREKSVSNVPSSQYRMRSAFSPALDSRVPNATNCWLAAGYAPTMKSSASAVMGATAVPGNGRVMKPKYAPPVVRSVTVPANTRYQFESSNTPFAVTLVGSLFGPKNVPADTVL